MDVDHREKFFGIEVRRKKAKTLARAVDYSITEWSLKLARSLVVA